MQMLPKLNQKAGIGGKSGETRSDIERSARLMRWRSSMERRTGSGGCTFRTCLCRQASKQAFTCCLAGPDSPESNAIGTFTEILEQ